VFEVTSKPINSRLHPWSVKCPLPPSGEVPASVRLSPLERPTQAVATPHLKICPQLPPLAQELPPSPLAALPTAAIPTWSAAAPRVVPTADGAEHGPDGVAWPLSPEVLAAMYAKSPITVVDRVVAPSLMLLGSGDLRVPHAQGREWVAALQSQPSPPEVVALEYPGEGHAIGGAEQQAHAVQAAVSWLVQHTAPQPPAAES